MRVHAALVGEGAGADERLIGAEIHVGRLPHVARHLRQLRQTARQQDIVAAFEGEVGYDADQIDVAAAFAHAVDGALHLRRATRHGRQRVGHGHVAIVVAVNAQLDTELAAHGLHRGGDVVGQGAAVGVAQDHDRGAGVLRRPQRLQGVLGVVPVAVEEVLGVVEHLAAGLPTVGHRVGDHAQVLIKGSAEDLAHVQVPRLADDGDDRRLGVEQRLEASVLGGLDALAAGHAEGGNASVPQRNLADFLEVLEVFRVGQRIAALDEVHAEFIEAARDVQLVLQGEVDTLALAAVAQGGVVDVDARHDGSCNKKALKRSLQGRDNRNLTRSGMAPGASPP